MARFVNRGSASPSRPQRKFFYLFSRALFLTRDSVANMVVRMLIQSLGSVRERRGTVKVHRLDGADALSPLWHTILFGETLLWLQQGKDTWDILTSPQSAPSKFDSKAAKTFKFRVVVFKTLSDPYNQRLQISSGLVFGALRHSHGAFYHNSISKASGRVFMQEWAKPETFNRATVFRCIRESLQTDDAWRRLQFDGAVTARIVGLDLHQSPDYQPDEHQILLWDHFSLVISCCHHCLGFGSLHQSWPWSSVLLLHTDSFRTEVDACRRLWDTVRRLETSGNIDVRRFRESSLCLGGDSKFFLVWV